MFKDITWKAAGEPRSFRNGVLLGLTMITCFDAPAPARHLPVGIPRSEVVSIPRTGRLAESRSQLLLDAHQTQKYNV